MLMRRQTEMPLVSKLRCWHMRKSLSLMLYSRLAAFTHSYRHYPSSSLKQPDFSIVA